MKKKILNNQMINKLIWWNYGWIYGLFFGGPKLFEDTDFDYVDML